MTTRHLFACATTALFATTVFAAADFKITEAYTGVSGSDGTPDWFELTNFGDMTGNTGGLFYDDNSADPTNNYALPAFDVDPGESVIVLIEAVAADVNIFYAFWGLTAADVQVGITGGGSLGQGGDAVNVFDGNLATSNLVDSLVYGGALAGLNGTIEDNTGVGPLANSVLGVNGAFASAGVSGIGTLIGSPGIIPEPTSLLLIALGAFAIRRR